MRGRVLCVAAASAICTAASAVEMERTAGAVCDLLERVHVSHRAPDDVISRRAWTNLLESCDRLRMTFLSSDIARFEKQETSLDDMFRKGDLSFAADVRSTYLKRLEARTAFATNFLATAAFDFSKKGRWATDRHDAAWPATVAAADRLWKAKLRNDTLAAFLACETGGVKKAAAKVSKRLVDALERERRRGAETVTNDFLSAIASSYDAHTAYLSPALSNSLMGEMSLSMCGIGAEWTPEDGGVLLKRIIPGGPLAKDGRISVGDKLVAVSPKADGRFTSLDGVSSVEGASLFFGEKDAPMTLEVEHADGRHGVYTLKRARVSLDSEAASSSVVPATSKGTPSLGYLRLQSFYVSAPSGKDGKPRSSCEDVAERLRELAKAKVGGVLLDLRGNGGGSLHDAVKIIGLFVRSGPAVQLTGVGDTMPVDIIPGETVCETPLVVLVDGMSASASELVSATLQDLGRAVVAGDVQTVGKGSAQSSVDLSTMTETGGEGTLLVTRGKFYRVTGSSTQFKGVASDIVLPSVSMESIREENLDYPLPWDEISAVPYEKAWDLDRFIPELRTSSEARRSKSGKWKRHARFVRLAAKCEKRTANSLEINARRRQIAEEKSVRNETLRLMDDGFNPAKRGADPVLDEGLNILADLVRLNGGRTLPAAKAPAPASEEGLFDSLDD